MCCASAADRMRRGRATQLGSHGPTVCSQPETATNLSGVKARAALLVLAGLGCAMFYVLHKTSAPRPLPGATRSSVRELVEHFSPPARPWNTIVIHHSATPTGNARVFHRHHRDKRRWRHGLGYHFVVGNGSASGDGEIEVGGRWRRQLAGAHCRHGNVNPTGIGICLVGDFEEGPGPTRAQLDALVSLTACLRKRFHIPLSRVLLHRDVPGAKTKCPGQNFPTKEIMTRLRQADEAEWDTDAARDHEKSFLKNSCFFSLFLLT